MLKILKRMFIGSSKKAGNLSTVGTTETKKCLNCLKRVALHHPRCPHCRKDDFEYNS